jgi:RND family efflux transporter MFP subunit
MAHPRAILSALAVSALAAAGAGCRNEAAAGPAPGRTGGAEAAPRPVRVVAVARGALPRVVEVSGTLAAEEQVALALKVSGRLAELAVDLGSRVERGQTLGRLAPTDFELRLAQAEAALEQARSRLGLAPDTAGDAVEADATPVVRQARAQLEEARLRHTRAQALARDQLLAPSELDAVAAEYQVAESRYQDALDEVMNRRAVLAQRRSELALARQQLADSTLTAPFAGAVRERHATPGEYVPAGQPIVTLVRLHPLRLRLSVPEREAAALRVGQPVRVKVEGDAALHIGRVARLSPVIEESSRTLRLEAEVANEDGALRPGAFADAEIVTSADEPVLFVPRTAIVPFAGIEKVIAVADGRAVERRVRTGRRHEDQVEVVEGLAEGEPIVASPGNLTGGEPVTAEP